MAGLQDYRFASALFVVGLLCIWLIYLVVMVAAFVGFIYDVSVRRNHDEEPC